VDLYSTFIVVPHTQGAQVRITQFYLQITPHSLYLEYAKETRTEQNLTVCGKSEA